METSVLVHTGYRVHGSMFDFCIFVAFRRPNQVVVLARFGLPVAAIVPVEMSLAPDN